MTTWRDKPDRPRPGTFESDVLAIYRILSSNGLRHDQIDSLVDFDNRRRITALAISGSDNGRALARITADIGLLTELRRLHLEHGRALYAPS